jgi:hypothetical protein
MFEPASEGLLQRRLLAGGAPEVRARHLQLRVLRGRRLRLGGPAQVARRPGACPTKSYIQIFRYIYL